MNCVPSLKNKAYELGIKTIDRNFEDLKIRNIYENKVIY